MRYVRSLDNIPDGEHYVAFLDEKVNIPGDERSRTNPGHGYPAHTISAMSLIFFDDIEEMKGWFEKEMRNNHHVVYGKKTSLIVKMSKVNLDMRVEIDVVK